MSKFSRVIFSSALALATVSLAAGCAEQKGAKKEDKKDDKKADKKTDEKAAKQD